MPPDKSKTSELTTSIEGAENLEALAIHRLAARLQRVEPMVYELLVLAAVPRTFNRSVLAALFGVTAESREFLDGYARLLELPFIRSHGHLRSVDTEFRQPVLEQWHRNPIPGQDIDDVRLKVIGLWTAQFEDARRADEQLSKIATIMREANPDRYRGARDSLEAAMAPPLLEAQSAAVERDPTDGLERFERWFYECEGRGKYRLAELLVRGFSEDAAAVPDSATRTRLAAWAGYYRARLAVPEPIILKA